MTSSFVASASRAPVQDVLAQLPISTCLEYRKGQIIYGPAQPSASIYLIAAGKVKLSQLARDGSEILLEIIVPDELFGESAFVDRAHRAEQATALENAKLMLWPITAMEDLVTKRPSPHRKPVDRQSRTAAIPLAHPLLRTPRHPAGRRIHPDDAIYSRTALPAHRHHARNRYAPYEPVSEARLPALFPSGDRPLPACRGRVERQPSSFCRCLFVIQFSKAWASETSQRSRQGKANHALRRGRKSLSSRIRYGGKLARPSFRSSQKVER
jgi:hypothetical protein